MEECRTSRTTNEPIPGQVLRYKAGGDLYLVITPDAGGLTGPRRMVKLKDGNIWSTTSLYGSRVADDFEIVNCCYKVTP